MGSSLSCGCDRQPHFPDTSSNDTSNSNSITPLPSSSIPDNTATFKFSAELFQLSSDCSQWILLYPRLLSVSIFELLTNRPSLLLFASSRSHLVFHQVIDLPRDVKRVSPCFAYWRYSNEIYGVNIVRSKDCDRFCELLAANPRIARMQQHPVQQTSSSSKSLEHFSAEASRSITIRDAFIRHGNTNTSNCVVEIRLRPTAIQIGDTTVPLNLDGAKIDLAPEKRCAVCKRPQELKIVKADTDPEIIPEAAATNSRTSKTIPKIKVEQETTKVTALCEQRGMKPKEKYRHFRPTLCMQRSLHAPAPNDYYENDISDMPSTSWQNPQASLNPSKRAKSSERSPTNPEISLNQGDKSWSGPLRSANHKLNHRDPGLLSHLAFEKLNNKDERRRSMPNALLQISHFSDLSRGHLVSSINELVSTEELYVKHLQKLISQYLRPLKLPMLELTEVLHQIQTSFLSSLLDAAGDTVHSTEISEQQLRDALIRIFALFVNKCSKFKIYSEYSATFLRFQQERKEKWKTVRELEKMNSSKEQSEGVQSLLIKPIQRVLKYPLFLQQMKDNCAKGCVERQQGEQALQRMQALAEYINEMQRLIEQYGKEIEEIALKNSTGSQMRFSQLLMFAHVDWLGSEKGTLTCLAFVFTSVVLILCQHHPKSKGKFYRILPVLEVEVAASIDDASESKYFFTLTHKNPQLSASQTFQLCCCQLNVKAQFIKAIQKAAMLMKKEQRRPLSGSSQSDGGYGSERLHS